MNRNYSFLPAISRLGLLLPLLLCLGCVDPDFNLGNLNVEGVVLNDLEVPIGSFQEITLDTILSAEGAEMTSLPSGVYFLSGSATLAGIDLNIIDKGYFRAAELYTVILNTLPLDMDFSVTALDAEGNPCQNVTLRVDSEKSPAIASGTKANPSSNPVIFRLSCPDGCQSLSKLKLSFSGRTGEGFEQDAPQGDEGITLTQVYLKVPGGLIVRL